MSKIFIPYASQPIERTSERVVIDPITRIEGHLRVEVELAGNEVIDAWSTGTMFRGIEIILKDRDPREAWLFAQRICGVCTTVHALASVTAVEDALDIDVPDNAHLVRNLVTGAQYLQDHVVHFYHLHSPDWVDFAVARDGDPTATAALAQSISDWPKATTEYFQGVRDRLRAFVDSGQLGILGGAFRGHPAYRLDPEASLLFFSHYLEALAWQREIVKIHAILGGKNPHPQTYLVGGMAVPIDPGSADAIGMEKLDRIRQLASEARTFVAQVYLPDLLLLASYYPQWTGLGRGVKRYLTLGGFTEVGAQKGTWLPPGILPAADLTAGLREPDPSAIGESIARSWYRYSDGTAGPKHPFAGETDPAYTGPTPPYEHLDTADKYSWLKAPRYDGLPMEVGPLARMAVAYAAGHDAARQAMDDVLDRLDADSGALFSTLGRMLTRGIETLLVAERIEAWVDELADNISRGITTCHDGRRWDPETWPSEAEGWSAVAAPRGMLTHWLRIAGDKIAHYQAVVPSTWNGSPRDAESQRGPWEEALVGTPVADPDRPLEVLRTVHSFDPCLACAVHLVDGQTPPGETR